MKTHDQDFDRRAERIPHHGVGLSVDLHAPDVLELSDALRRAGLTPDYLEVFKAPTSELLRVRQVLAETRFAYHAEGLWCIDPEMTARYPWKEAADTIARHADALGAAWANHECAGKQLGGYSFGTYLPPVYTNEIAEATAANVRLCQARLDEWNLEKGRSGTPLLLLELAPLTYFGVGDIAVAEFFRQIVDAASCGLVLDIGHLWTVWRYRERGSGADLETFAAEFLAAFPLHRVLQVHLAGLGPQDSHAPQETFPWWIDAHDAPVPEVLWKLLRQVLDHPGLVSLKGMALEVDTKEIPMIVEEFRRLQDETGHAFRSRPVPLRAAVPYRVRRGEAIKRSMGYETYARVVSGQQALADSDLRRFEDGLEREGLRRYCTVYLPHELMTWGGDLEELFPDVWRHLRARGLTDRDFVRFWFGKSTAVIEPYDFFSLKLTCWGAFVHACAPELAARVDLDIERLRRSHDELNGEPSAESPSVSMTALHARAIDDQ